MSARTELIVAQVYDEVQFQNDVFKLRDREYPYYYEVWSKDHADFLQKHCPAKLFYIH